MSKSIKFRNNTYLDSSSIVHNKEPLNEIINTPIKTSAMNTYYAKKNLVNFKAFFVSGSVFYDTSL